MDGKLMYAFRGWIAFVAFVDFSTAVRSYIEKRSFLGSSTSDIDYDDDKYTIARIVGIYSILKALALIHCTLFIHYKPVVSMGICSIIVTVALYLTEISYFKTATFNFLITFPCVLNVVTLVGLIYLPKHLKIWDPLLEIEEDDTRFLKQANALRRKRNARKFN